jgi:hypothetical protein
MLVPCRRRAADCDNLELFRTLQNFIGQSGEKNKPLQIFAENIKYVVGPCPSVASPVPTPPQPLLGSQSLPLGCGGLPSAVRRCPRFQPAMTVSWLKFEHVSTVYRLRVCCYPSLHWTARPAWGDPACPPCSLDGRDFKFAWISMTSRLAADDGNPVCVSCLWCCRATSVHIAKPRIQTVTAVNSGRCKIFRHWFLFCEQTVSYFCDQTTVSHNANISTWVLWLNVSWG